MSLLDLLKKELNPVKDDDEPDWVSPYNSEWILAVNDSGEILVIGAPAIHDCFFENGRDADSIGLPTQTDEPMGVYRCKCSFHESKDWETGWVDDWHFEIEEMIPIWQMKEIPDMNDE